MRNVTLSLTAVSVIAATMMSSSPRGVAAVEQCAALPYVGLPFASGSTDGQAFAHHFMSKQSNGWKGTIDLLANDEQSDAPARFRTQCWSVSSNDFALENAQGDTLAHVDVEGDRSLGDWSFKLFDCNRKLLATVEQKSSFMDRLLLSPAKLKKVNLQIKVSADHTYDIVIMTLSWHPSNPSSIRIAAAARRPR